MNIDFKKLRVTNYELGLNFDSKALKKLLVTNYKLGSNSRIVNVSCGVDT